MHGLFGSSLLVVLFVATALFFDFLNGFHDSANTIATMIASRAMGPRQALALNAVANLVGPFLFGIAVAQTVGHEVIAERAASVQVVWAALAGAIVWNVVTWLLGLPSSSSHALVGGLIGAAVLSDGFEAVLLHGLTKVLLTLLVSPIVGLLSGYLLMGVTLTLARGASPRISHVFKRAQVITAAVLALSHGTNDAQKTMGIIAMGLLAMGELSHFVIPAWVVAACAGAMALGTALGGWRIIRTLGAKFYRIRPVHSLSSQLASAGVILAASLIGGPVSTTHVVSTAIVGAGAAERLNKVRWGVVGDVVVAWLLTIPASALLAGLVYGILHYAA